MICYADNLTDADLSAFQRFHMGHDGVLSMALFHTNLPQQCGIAALDREGRVVEFQEKPAHPKSNLANEGMYIARQEIFRLLPEKPELDFGKDVLPQLVGRMYGWQTQGYLIDIGTKRKFRKSEQGVEK